MTAATAEGTFTLTRDEGYAVACEMRHYNDTMTAEPTDTREDLAASIEILQGEVAILDGGDWWGDGNPARIDLRFKVGDGPQAPESYPFAAEALPALIDRLPAFAGSIAETVSEVEQDVIDARSEFHRQEEIQFLADARRRHAALTGLAARLGVQTAA